MSEYTTMNENPQITQINADSSNSFFSAFFASFAVSYLHRRVS